MSDRILVRVHYPLESGAIVLRGGRDWSRSLEPVGGDAAGTRFDFELPVEGRHTYFKPLLLAEGGETWAQGGDVLALPDGPRELDVHPYFFADTHCHTCTLHEVNTGETRHSLRLFYPPGYEENTLERFPVVYLQDGQNLFFPDEAFGGHHWMIEETLRVLDSMCAVRRTIAVGIYPRDRMEEYTKPGYRAYGRALVEEIVPWVENRLRTLPGAANRALMGSSLGGVVSLHLALAHPDVFGHAACLSSTFGYRDDLFERVEREERRPVRVYLDSGWPQDNFEATRAMRNRLLARGWTLGTDLLYLAFPHARHDERAWAMRAHIPLQLFFGT